MVKESLAAQSSVVGAARVAFWVISAKAVDRLMANQQEMVEEKQEYELLPASWWYVDVYAAAVMMKGPL